MATPSECGHPFLNSERAFVVRSAYRPVWLMTMFDLPVDSPQAKRRYTRFRKVLLDAGFMMIQYSVYARYCESEDAAEAKRMVVRAHLPIQGAVRMLSITDRQFGRMEQYLGKTQAGPDEPPGQLLLF